MMRRRASMLAWGLWGLFVVLMIGVIVLRPIFDVESLFAVTFLAFMTVGSVVAARRPANPLGWLFCAAALGAVLGAFSFNYALRSFEGPGELPFATVFAWLGSWAFFPGIGTTVTFGLLLFPTGCVPSPRWRVVAWAAAVMLVVVIAGLAFRAGPLDGFSGQGIRVVNPMGIAGARGLMTQIVSWGFMIFMGLALVSAVSLIVRYRRAASEERQQIKWFALAACAVAVALPLDAVLPKLIGQTAVQVFFATVLSLPPVALAIAILKYRLYDIDRVINRTLVYVVLTAILAAVYLALVFSLQQLLAPVARQSDLAVAGSTLAVAALFGPLRRRVQAFIDQRFYRRKYDAVLTVAEFSARLRNEIDIDQLNAELVGVVRRTMHPEHVWLWLRTQDADLGGAR